MPGVGFRPRVANFTVDMAGYFVLRISSMPGAGVRAVIWSLAWDMHNLTVDAAMLSSQAAGDKSSINLFDGTIKLA
jgi:hypothetical protein